ncbi:hypothetical protein LR010_02185 [Candidatus Gracilibacteria bacterium]|nr:hypothetical protein [Candidatus Gracilibacteria bacterium]
MKQKLLKILYKFLAFCSRIYLVRTKPIVIGVTGSVGKTSCRLVVSQVLEQVQNEKIIYTSPKNYNSELGLVFSIFKIEEYNPSFKNLLRVSWLIFKKSLLQKKQYDILIAEYGIDSPRDMDFLLSIMKPYIGVLTKLDSVHSENFDRGITELWEDKFKLLLASKNKVYFNAGDSFALENSSLLSCSYEKIFASTPKADLKHGDKGIFQKFLYKKKSISVNLLGEENIEYTVLALKIAGEIGFKIERENYDFHFNLQPGRFSIFERNENIFIDSSYNASPESMKKVIENTKLIQQKIYQNHKIIYVLGDMREIGEERFSAHESLAQLIQDGESVILIGPDMYKYLLPKLKEGIFTGDIHSTLSAREGGIHLKKYLKDNSECAYIVLFKGSQNTIFTEEALAVQLLAAQRKNLPRQTEDWMKKKDEFFKSL